MLWSTFIGGLVAVVGGHYVAAWLLDRVAAQFYGRWGGEPPVPEAVSPEIWKAGIVEHAPGDAVLGHLERLIFFAAFWVAGGWALAAAWLVFKVVAKWHAWNALARLGDAAPLEDRAALLARAAFDYRLFVLGTAVNLVAGIAGLAVGGLFL
jgi:hypothetical protein